MVVWLHQAKKKAWPPCYSSLVGLEKAAHEDYSTTINIKYVNTSSRKHIYLESLGDGFRSKQGQLLAILRGPLFCKLGRAFFIATHQSTWLSCLCCGSNLRQDTANKKIKEKASLQDMQKASQDSKNVVHLRCKIDWSVLLLWMTHIPSTVQVRFIDFWNSLAWASDSGNVAWSVCLQCQSHS